ncbi:MAG: Mut7-C ubiquitin/RNAse domain-containing protein [Burkholderiales bacterium]|nr:Mut7-C ubiquitin/RNAse domain-containing protein [Nitrosomonas sp.]MCP5276349.1 Mut7-C ubiquitin/RNAse domain-containing protein [Burkholderiales bacterium]
MEHAHLHFHADLKDFIVPLERHKIIVHDFNRKASIKDVIESYNVPHTEIDLILVNDISVGFDYIVQNGDDIHVHPLYPRSQKFRARPILHLSPPISGKPKFIIDVNLGRLARYMRLLGFDCLYCNHFDDKTIAEISSKTQRIVLTRDRKLLKRKVITYGYFVRAEFPKIQVKEVLIKFNLHPLIKPLTRCTYCNGKLIQTEKRYIEHRLPPLTKKHYDKFLTCSDCDQIYWQGSHSSRVEKLIKEFSGDSQ